MFTRLLPAGVIAVVACALDGAAQPGGLVGLLGQVTLAEALTFLAISITLWSLVYGLGSKGGFFRGLSQHNRDRIVAMEQTHREDLQRVYDKIEELGVRIMRHIDERHGRLRKSLDDLTKQVVRIEAERPVRGGGGVDPLQD